MWVSEVKTKSEIKLGRFNHRKIFETLEEGLEWARDLAFSIAANEGRWTDEDLVMNHREIGK
jgi:hypothetical protein